MSATKTTKGLLGTKLGMTQVWDENNTLIPVTVVEIAPNVVTQVRTPEVDGYAAVQIAYGAIDPRKVTKPLGGHFEKAGSTPRRHLTEVRTADAGEYTPGQELAVDIFEAGQRVDVVGTSKGKGFAGVMKRHNFKGVSASHGAHRNHRKPGSIGASSTPSRVFKGMRMAGRMGGDRVTVLNLTVHSVDLEKGLLLVKGAVPGAVDRSVFAQTAVKEAVAPWLTSLNVVDPQHEDRPSHLPRELFYGRPSSPACIQSSWRAPPPRARSTAPRPKGKWQIFPLRRRAASSRGHGPRSSGSIRAPQYDRQRAASLRLDARNYATALPRR